MNRDIYLIDGHAQIYRAYFALMNLKSPGGEPTNATFGFISALLKLISSRRPSYLAVAMDAGSSQREQIDAQYKATRSPMPEDMPIQIQRIVSMLQGVPIPTLRVEGYEADDVVATVVRRILEDPAQRENRIFICTRDKDLEALINERVFLYDIERDEVTDAAALVKKKGYPPEHVRDILALTGDTSDNIPGIPGVGPKTAAKWIAQYGSLDDLLKHVDEIGGKVGQSLRDHLDVLAKSRQLVQLQTDVPLNISPTELEFHAEGLRHLLPTFVELSFKSLIPQTQKLLQESGLSVDAPPLGGSSSAREARAVSAIEPGDLPGTLFSGLMAESTKPAAPASSTPPQPATPTGEPPTPPIRQLSPVVGDYTLVNSLESLHAMAAEIKAQLKASPNRWLAVDTETDALSSVRANLCGISLSARAGRAWYIAVKGPECRLGADDIYTVVAPLLSDPSITKIGQNIKYDLNVLRRYGYEFAGPLLDTMIASYLIDSSRRSHSMDSLAADLLGLSPIPIKDLIGSGTQQRSFADVPLDQACRYAAEDADVTLRLAAVLAPAIAEKNLTELLDGVEMPMVRVLADMEFAGISIDRALLESLDKQMGEDIARLKEQVIAEAGVSFNIDSPKQLGEVLFQKLGLPVQRRTRTGRSTDIEVLQALADMHPVPRLVMEYRGLTKLRSTYVIALLADRNPETGRVHTSFNQTVAETGRLSSSDPNLQNIPIRTEAGKEIRRAFVAPGPDWCLISADYSQIELRVLAHFCREPALLEAFENNIDIHQYVAMQIFHVAADQVTPDMRRLAKTVNFGIVYGQTPFGLAHTLKISRDEAARFIDTYKARFPGISHFTTQCVLDASTNGFVSTILGRRRYIPELKSPNQSVRQFGQRVAVNSVIQGSAADLIKKAMVNIHSKNPISNLRMLLQVHDELVFECPRSSAAEAMEFIRHEMETAMTLAVPLRVDIGSGPNWLDIQ
ncbi:MAG: DNA polymerase I [Phycisphaerae bacterium]